MVAKSPIAYYLTSTPLFNMSVCPLPVSTPILKSHALIVVSLENSEKLAKIVGFPPKTDLLWIQNSMNRIPYEQKYTVYLSTGQEVLLDELEVTAVFRLSGHVNIIISEAEEVKITYPI